MRVRVVAVLAIFAAVVGGVVACTPSAPVSSPPTSPTSSVPGQPPRVVAPPQSGSFRQPGAVRRIGGCAVFDRDHFLNAGGVDRLPVHPASRRWTAFLGRGAASLHAPSSVLWEGSRSGQSFNVVNSAEIGAADVWINPTYAANNYLGRYPIPAAPRVEGYPGAAWDRHLLIVDTADCFAYEIIQYDPFLGALGVHTGLAGVRYPLSGVAAPVMTTNAADTPMVGQSALVAEVDDGSLAHPVGFCTDELAPRSVWPARRSDGRSTHPDAPPMGVWLRLRADVDTSGFTGQAAVIVNAMRRNGLILTDTCAHQMSFMGENSSGWDPVAVAQLGQLAPTDFEVVDATPMMVSSNSFQIR